MTNAASARQAWMVAQVPLRPTDRVLELGCGHGVAATAICDRLEGGRYLGVDRSATMIEAATARNRRHVDGGRAAFQAADVVAAELSGIYDWVVAIHLPVIERGDPSAELAALRPHLDARSRLVVGFQPPGASGVDAIVARLATILPREGFTVRDVVRGDPGGRPAAVVVAAPR